MFEKGIFGGLFDFNGDGKLDAFEKAADMAAFIHLVESSENKQHSKSEDE